MERTIRSSRRLRRLHVVPSVADRRKGTVIAGTARFACALGRSGLRRDKREGDGATPIAALPLRMVFYRGDRTPRPATCLPARPTRRRDAWCDDTTDRRYNRLIDRDPDQAEERLSRADALYDVVVVLGWNDRPVRRGRGSAIFWHLARPGFTPTAGCVAVTAATFAKLLPRLARDCLMLIGPAAVGRRR